MDTIDEYVKYFLTIVPYNNFKRLGHVFHTDENLYFLDSGTGKIFQCEQGEYDVLGCLTEEGTAESIKGLAMDPEVLQASLRTVRQMVEQENILKMPIYETFEPADKEIIKEMVEKNLRQLILEVTQSCNLRCKYCIYQKDSEGFRDFSSSHMTWETAKKAIDYAYAHSGDKLGITFYGGEPLVNYELVRKCIEYSKQFENQKEEVTYSFTSNLTLMTKERAEFFASVGNCSIMGSIDGPQEIHDRFRVTEDHKGSFSRAMQGLKFLVEAYGERAKNQISINAVLTPPYSEKKYDQVNSFFKEIPWLPEEVGVRCNYQDPDTYESAFPEGVPGLYENKNGVVEKNGTIDSWAVSHVLDHSQSVVHNTIAENILVHIHHRQITNKPIPFMHRNGCCIPGQRRLYVTAEGEFKVCERVGEAPYMGDVSRGIEFDRLYQSYIKDYEENMAKHCSDCWCVHLCNQCYSTYCTKDGIDFQKKQSSCDTVRKNIERELINYHTIQEKQPHWVAHLNEMQPV